MGLVNLKQGEFFIVPTSVEHKPVAERSPLILIERKTTLNTGQVRNERTVKRLEKQQRTVSAGE